MVDSVNCITFTYYNNNKFQYVIINRLAWPKTDYK